MKFEMIDGLLTITLDLISSSVFAVALLMFGYFIRRKVNFFEKYCFPAPVIGGFAFALLALVFHITGAASFKLDTTLQTPFMLAFFTTVGLGGSFALLKAGGKALIIYLVACWVLAILQNGFGVGLASILGLHPLMGVMAGAVSLEGGHGAAATFGPEAEAMGAYGAAAVAIASATFGLIAGNLTGGPIARRLITKNKLEIKVSKVDGLSSYMDKITQQETEEKVTSKGFLFSMLIIGLLMLLGVAASDWIRALKIPNFFIPGYVGAMFGAILLRNVNDKFQFIKLNTKIINLISEVSIGMFLSFAMMSLRIWDLASLAVPLLIILFLQVALLIVLTYFVLFRLLGRDYDAAVMCAGMLGHGLGATPNAVANMGAVCEHYGLRSNKAFTIVPLCGAVLIDLVALPCISLFLGIFGG
ncbi:MAG: sodium/glutamate symporter [Treponema sp.]|jgi:ESS family glutamate:Na+ symporter|nr:sodium/glutamate symporter [Treponema sp.]